MDSTRLAPQNPLAIASFILVEFQTMKQTDRFFAHFGAANYVDVTSEATAAGEWASLSLTTRDTPHLLAFIAGECDGEVEFIFSGGRLVQAGFLLVGGLPEAPFLNRVSEAIRATLGIRFSVGQVSPTHTVFSNNVLNGYLHRPDPSRLAYRVSDLKWCETLYGPATRGS